MNNTLNSQILGIITRVQNYPGLKGLREIESKISAICNQHQAQFPTPVKTFLEGYAFDRQDNLPKAIELYEKSLSELGDDDVQLEVFINGLLASIYVDFEEFQRGYHCYERALRNLHRVDDNVSALIYCNISDLYLTLGQYHDAILYAKLGAKAAQNASRFLDYAICSLNLAFSYSHIGEFDKGLKALHQAKQIGIQMKSDRTLALYYGYKAQIMVQCIDSKTDQRFTEQQVTQAFALAEDYYVKVVDEHNRVENLAHWAKYLESVEQLEASKKLCTKLESEFDIKASFQTYSVYAKTRANLYRRDNDWQSLANIQSQHIVLGEASLEQHKAKQSCDIVKKVDTVRDTQHADVLNQIQKHMGSITEIGQFIATTHSLDSVLPEILTKINSILPTFEFGIALYDHVSDVLDYRYFVDTMGLVEPMQVVCAESTTVGSYVIKQRATVHLNSVTPESLAPYIESQSQGGTQAVIVNNKPDTNSIILTPILLNEQVIGLLSVQHSQANQYQTHHRYLIEHLASFIAVSLENQKQRLRLETANNELEHLYKIEPLTGLYNRYQLDSIPPTLIRQASLNAQTLAVLMIDLDEYKAYNDYHGHLQGDEALRIISQILKSVFSEEHDSLFRYGGDEFMAVCYGQSMKTIEKKVNELRVALNDANLDNPSALRADRLTVSIGGVNMRFGDSMQEPSFKNICDQADKQLYLAKACGRNDVKLKALNSLPTEALIY
ncbi:diguanylate cyclase [Vibrio fortis]|uniref:diguanylate cyclase n=1 Tax=Vibrio fortis TaxID=212667 RepID=UPI003EBB204B